MEITMYFVKETPGTLLYAERERQDGKNRNLYLPKPDAAAIGKPDAILVTVTPL